MVSKFDELRVSGSVQINFKCTWTIRSFSSLDSEVGKCHQSGVFKPENDMEWFLRLYPGGIKETNEGYVACFVHVKKLLVSECKFRISFLNTDCDVLYDEGYNDWRNIMPIKGRGYHETIKAETLKRKLINDTLIVTVNATYCVTRDTNCVPNRHCTEITPIMKAVEHFKKMWIDRTNTDSVISAGQVDIPVHSAVLCASSKVFSAMFEHDPVGKTTRRVEVTDFEKNTMLSFVEYIYSGSVSKMSFDLALELLRASDKYEVSDLKLYCYNHLKSLVNKENVCQVLLSADVHNAEELRSHALEYFCKTISKEDFQNLRSRFETRPALICDIVEGMIDRHQI